MDTRLKNLCKENRSLAVFLLLMFVFRSTLADWNDVPTGSMLPTIVEGDRILVNKMAYDIRVPFTNISLFRRGNPERGDIVVFDSSVSDKRLVKRVVGVPGDLVELRDNTLLINGQALEYQDLNADAETSSSTLAANSIDKYENLLGVEHLVRQERIGSQFSSFAPVRIPAERYLCLGDNRDNSADSRVIGLIPRDEIVGRSRSVVLSLDYNNYYLPRSDRYLHTL